MSIRHGILGPLVVKYIDRHNVQLVVPLTYNHPNMIDRIEVPVGFVSDGVSIKFLRNIGLFFLYAMLAGYGLRAAIIHDYMYRTPQLKYTKLQADDMFKLALRADGVSRWRTWVIYQGVNLGGGYAWKKYRS